MAVCGQIAAQPKLNLCSSSTPTAAAAAAAAATATATATAPERMNIRININILINYPALVALRDYEQQIQEAVLNNEPTVDRILLGA